jgi:hypothetical protein
MNWKRLPRKLLSCWVGDGAKGVCVGELPYGKSIENVLRRCTHAFESESSDTTTLYLHLRACLCRKQQQVRAGVLPGQQERHSDM